MAQDDSLMEFSLIDTWGSHVGLTIRFFRLMFWALGIYVASFFFVRWREMRRLRGSLASGDAFQSVQLDGLDRAGRVRALERHVRIRCYESSRGLRMLLAVGLSAPLVGVAGLVVGLTNVFRALSLTSTGGFAAASAGFLEALEPLAVGLGIGLISFWSYMILVGSVERAGVKMRRQLEEMVRSSVA